MPQATDETRREWVQRLKAGDANAFDEVYDHHHARLYGFLLRMTRRRDWAEDLTQETWIRLATHAARLRDDSHLGAWLFTVARNLCVSRQRWHILESQRVSVGVLELSRRRDDEASPFDLTSAAQSARGIEQALAALPLRYREAILLVGVEGMSQQEAAQVLGIRDAALRQRLTRARAMLDHLLKEPTMSTNEREAL